MNKDIIIPVWNELELTKKCIESIKKNTRVSYRIIVIDNGSDTGTKDYLASLEKEKEIILIRNKENIGFPRAVNQGISLSDAPYICLLNNDTLVYENWLKGMINIMEREQDIGIVNPASNNLGMKESFNDSYIETASCLGFCMLIKREVIEKIGMLDEIYSPGNFEDTDFSKRAGKAGYKCVIAKSSYVYHNENTSFEKRGDWNPTFKRNQELFYRKWGKPKRVLYVLDSVKDEDRMNVFLKNGDWVNVFLRNKNGLKKEHAYLKVMELGNFAFRIKTLFRILTKKKKYTDIYTDDKFLYGVLLRLQVTGNRHQVFYEK